MKDKKPLLDLSTDKTLGVVNIEDSGKTLPYDLIKVGSLDVLQRDRLAALTGTLTSVSIKTAKDEKKYDETLLEILCIVIPSAPRELLSKLPFMEKMRTVRAHLEASGLIKKKVTPLTPGPRARKKNPK